MLSSPILVLELKRRNDSYDHFFDAIGIDYHSRQYSEAFSKQLERVRLTPSVLSSMVNSNLSDVFISNKISSDPEMKRRAINASQKLIYNLQDETSKIIPNSEGILPSGLGDIFFSVMAATAPFRSSWYIFKAWADTKKPQEAIDYMTNFIESNPDVQRDLEYIFKNSYPSWELGAYSGIWYIPAINNLPEPILISLNNQLNQYINQSIRQLDRSLMNTTISDNTRGDITSRIADLKSLLRSCDKYRSERVVNVGNVRNVGNVVDVGNVGNVKDTKRTPLLLSPGTLPKLDIFNDSSSYDMNNMGNMTSMTNTYNTPNRFNPSNMTNTYNSPVNSYNSPNRFNPSNMTNTYNSPNRFNPFNMTNTYNSPVNSYNSPVNSYNSPNRFNPVQTYPSLVEIQRSASPDINSPIFDDVQNLRSISQSQRRNNYPIDYSIPIISRSQGGQERQEIITPLRSPLSNEYFSELPIQSISTSMPVNTSTPTLITPVNTSTGTSTLITPINTSVGSPVNTSTLITPVNTSTLISTPLTTLTTPEISYEQLIPSEASPIINPELGRVSYSPQPYQFAPLGNVSRVPATIATVTPTFVGSPPVPMITPRFVGSPTVTVPTVVSTTVTPASNTIQSVAQAATQ